MLKELFSMVIIRRECLFYSIGVVRMLFAIRRSLNSSRSVYKTIWNGVRYFESAVVKDLPKKSLEDRIKRVYEQLMYLFSQVLKTMLVPSLHANFLNVMIQQEHQDPNFCTNIHIGPMRRTWLIDQFVSKKRKDAHLEGWLNIWLHHHSMVNLAVFFRHFCIRLKRDQRVMT